MLTRGTSGQRLRFPAFSIFGKTNCSSRFFEVAEQLAHASALGADLGAGSLERLLGVQRPPLPGRLGLGVAAPSAAARCRRG